MTPRTASERGAAMVLVLGVLAVLTVLAMVVIAIVASEKRTALSEYSNTRSFYSADAASEAGVNWLQREYSPPPLVDSLSHVYVSTAYTTAEPPTAAIGTTCSTCAGASGRAGASNTRTTSTGSRQRGASAQQSEAAIEVVRHAAVPGGLLIMRRRDPALGSAASWRPCRSAGRPCPRHHL